MEAISNFFLTFSLDVYVYAFAKNNFVSMSIFVLALKGLSEVTSWDGDNKLADTVSAMWDFLKGNRNKP